MADLASLVVKLSAETASFNKGLNSAVSELRGFNKSVAGTLGSLKDLGAAMVGAFALDKLASVFKNAILQATEYEASMARMAQQVGVSTREFTGLAYAAKMNDVPVEDLAKSMGILDKQIAAAAGGSKQASGLFASMGIKVRDAQGNVKSANTVLLEMADYFGHTTDGAEKTAQALGVMGRGGKLMVPFLNEGRQAISDLIEEAQALGLVFSDASHAEEFRRNVKRLDAVALGFKMRLTEELIPSLNALALQLTNVSQQEDFTKFLSVIGDGFKGALILVNGFATGLAKAKLWLQDIWEFGGVIAASANNPAAGAAAFAAYQTNTKNRATEYDRLTNNSEDRLNAILYPEMAAAHAENQRLLKGGKPAGLRLGKAGTPPVDNTAELEKEAAAVQKLNDEYDGLEEKYRSLSKKEMSPDQQRISDLDHLIAEMQKFKKESLDSQALDVRFNAELNKMLEERNKLRAKELGLTEQQTEAMMRQVFLEQQPKPEFANQTEGMEWATGAGLNNKAPRYTGDLGALEGTQYKDSLKDENKRLAEQTQWYDATRTSAEKFAIEKQKLDALYPQKGDVYNRSLQRIKEQYDTNTIAAKEFGQAAGQAFQSLITGQATFTQALASLIPVIIDVILKLTLLKKVQADSAGGGLGGTFFNAVLSGMSGVPRASGGAVDPHHAYIVGERGPEPFIPNVAGTILPTSALGDRFNIYVDARNAEAGVSAEILNALNFERQKIVAQAVAISEERRKRR